MKCIPYTYGIDLGEAEIVSVCNHKDYAYWVLRTARQQVDIAITPTGLLRISKPRKAEEYPRIDT
jgi:hypothetical protein